MAVLKHYNSLLYFSVKPEIKPDNQENGTSAATSSATYPSTLNEFFGRISPQMFLLQVFYISNRYEPSHNRAVTIQLN